MQAAGVSTGGSSGAPSIFDDFWSDFSGPSQSKPEQKKETLKLKVDDLIIESADRYSNRKFPHLSLYLLRGNQQLIKNSN